MAVRAAIRSSCSPSATLRVSSPRCWGWPADATWIPLIRASPRASGSVRPGTVASRWPSGSTSMRHNCQPSKPPTSWLARMSGALIETRRAATSTFNSPSMDNRLRWRRTRRKRRRTACSGKEVPVSRSVVIGLDASDLSARALPFAQDIAEQWRGRLILVHATGSGEERVPVPLELELHELVRELAEEGINADAVIRASEPAQAIVDVARERDADLIVMASHQRHGLDRWLNGSVTEKVLALSRAPLLVVPSHTTATRTRSQRILIPLDGTRVGEAPLDFLRERATVRPIEVLLVRIVSDAPIVVGMAPGFTSAPLTAEDLDAEVTEATRYLASMAESIRDSRVSA